MPVKPSRGGTQVLTANSLRDGRVVYLARDGSFVSSLEAARVLTDPGDAEEALAAGKRAFAARAVVDVYLIDVTVDGGSVVPVRYREQIRAQGPSVVGEESV